MLTIWIGLLLFVASLPWWMPSVVLALRMRIFASINGDEGIAIPGSLVDATQLKQLYAHPAANGRSRGAALSDLFWYWLSPGPEMHQEHIEPGELYEEVALSTRRILAISRQSAKTLTADSIGRVLLDEDFGSLKLVRLRDLMMPVWAEFYHQLVFGEPCSPIARRLIVENANDVVTALKCCSLRHMERRLHLTRYLVEQLESGRIAHELPVSLSTEQRAFYLQGVFFNTAIVQMSEAMAHLMMALAQHQDVQAKLADNLDDERYLEHVITETLRVYPLFGISHRITSADIAIDEQHTIPKGSVLCFNHPEYHRAGFEDADRFEPERWHGLPVREANYIPYGVPGNRPCPAQQLAGITLRVAAVELLRRFSFYSSASHTRSMPNRGPCLVVPRRAPMGAPLRVALLVFLAVRDRVEEMWRSVIQLVLGTYMVWDARRLRLCERFFASQDSGTGPAGADSCTPSGAGASADHQRPVCPVHGAR